MIRLNTALFLGWDTQFFAFSGEAIADERLALLIGNKDYTDSVGSLKNPHIGRAYASPTPIRASVIENIDRKRCTRNRSPNYKDTPTNEPSAR